MVWDVTLAASSGNPCDTSCRRTLSFTCTSLCSSPFHTSPRINVASRSGHDIRATATVREHLLHGSRLYQTDGSRISINLQGRYRKSFSLGCQSCARIPTPDTHCIIGDVSEFALTLANEYGPRARQAIYDETMHNALKIAMPDQATCVSVQLDIQLPGCPSFTVARCLPCRQLRGRSTTALRYARLVLLVALVSTHTCFSGIGKSLSGH